MNAILDHVGLLAEQTEPSSSTTYTLRRTGRKAVRFDGWQLVEAIGSAGNRTVWHDLNVYRTVEDHIVVELIARRNHPDHQEVVHVKTFNDFGAAALWLEAYRSADDIPIPAGLSDGDVALPWAVLQAVQLRQSIDRVEADYRALLSEVFAALDLTDPAEVQGAPERRLANAEQV